MRNLKKIMVLVLLVTTILSYGQHRPDKEKIKALKVGFITERLDLSTKEAQIFWPIYNDYQENREALRNKERSQIRSKIKNLNELSEKKARALLLKYISIEEEQEELDNLFLNEISKVVTAKKALLLLRSEEDFKRHLIKQYRQKKRR